MSQQPLAYLYPEFLESAEARPIRILSEYLEPLQRFKDQKIQDTVVFFGSARDASRAGRARGGRPVRGRVEPVAQGARVGEILRGRERAVTAADDLEPHPQV